MKGRVDDGDWVTIEPCLDHELCAGDIVLARVQGRRHSHLVLHLIHRRDADQFLIGSNNGRIDGWIALANTFGKVTDIQPPAEGKIETI